MKPQFGRRIVGRGQVGRLLGEGCAEALRLPHEGESAVVGNVQPLVAVRGDGLGTLGAGGEVGGPRRHAREQPEGAVDVKPGAVLLGQVGHLVDRVEVARVHLAGVGDDDRGVAPQLGEAALQCVEVEAARRVPGQLAHVVGADPEHRQRLDRARVDVPAREDRDLRGARQSRAARCAAHVAPRTSRGRPPGR